MRDEDDDLWAKNCDGDIKERIHDIKHFQKVARMNETLAAAVQSGLDWIIANCKSHIVASFPVLFNCTGDSSDRIKALESYLKSASQNAPDRKEKEAELQFLRNFCPEESNRCPRTEKQRLHLIAEVERLIKKSKADKSLIECWTRQLAFYQCCGPLLLCPKCKTLQDRLKELEGIRDGRKADRKARIGARIAKLEQSIAAAIAAAKKTDAKLEKVFMQDSDVLKGLIGSLCTGNSTCTFKALP
jgi:hypothetical protein